MKKFKSILKGLVEFVTIILCYMCFPSIIYSLANGKFSENVCSLLGELLLIGCILIYYNKQIKENIKDFKINFKAYSKLCIKYWLFGILIMIFSNFIINYFIFPGEIATNEALNRNSLINAPIIGFFLVVLFTPFCEEVIFRLSFRNFVTKSKYFPLLTGIIFGGLHAVVGISTPLELLYIIPYGALGYVFGYTYNKTDNIFTSTFMHTIHNLICYLIIIFGV